MNGQGVESVDIALTASGVRLATATVLLLVVTTFGVLAVGCGQAADDAHMAAARATAEAKIDAATAAWDELIGDDGDWELINENEFGEVYKVFVGDDDVYVLLSDEGTSFIFDTSVDLVTTHIGVIDVLVSPALHLGLPSVYSVPVDNDNDGQVETYLIDADEDGQIDVGEPIQESVLQHMRQGGGFVPECTGDEDDDAICIPPGTE